MQRQGDGGTTSRVKMRKWTSGISIQKATVGRMEPASSFSNLNLFSFTPMKM